MARTSARKKPDTPAPAELPSVRAVDVGDRVCVAVWRALQDPRPNERPGSWSTLWGRVVAVRRDGTLLSYETDSNPPPDVDTPNGSRLRFTKSELCFETQAAADSACRALPDPQ